MTWESFAAFYPQFASFEPRPVAIEYLRQASSRFASFGDDAEEARRLFVAHRLTLYALTAPPPGQPPTLADLAAAGRAERHGQIASKRVGEVQISYASTSSASASARATSLADLSETAFGLQLLTLLRLHSAPRYLR